MVDGRVTAVGRRGRARADPRPAAPCCSAATPARTRWPACAAGDPVTVTLPAASRPTAGAPARGGRRQHLLVATACGRASPTTPPAPRTAVGFSADGREDVHAHRGRPAGRQPRGHPRRARPDDGRTRRLQRAQPRRRRLVHAAGPQARRAAVRVENSPSDGSERPVPNGLASSPPRAAAGSRGFWVETAQDPDRRARAVAPVRGGAPGPGLSRPDPPARPPPATTRRTARRPAPRTGGPTPGSDGIVGRDGVFHARAPAAARSPPSRGAATRLPQPDRARPLARIGATTRPGRRWPARDGHAPLRRRRLRRAGQHRARSSPPTSRSTTTTTCSTITPTDGRATSPSTPRRATGAGAGHRPRRPARSTVLPVTVGLTDGRWPTSTTPRPGQFSQARATGSVSAAPGPAPAPACELTYDFSQSTAHPRRLRQPAGPDRGGRPAAGVRHVDQRQRQGRVAEPAPVRRRGTPQHVLRGPLHHLDRLAARRVRRCRPGSQYPLQAPPLLRRRDQRRRAVHRRRSSSTTSWRRCRRRSTCRPRRRAPTGR